MAEPMTQTNPDTLEKVYLQELDNSIISYLASSRNLSAQEAMDIYFNSALCNYVHKGTYGVQYLDYKLLVDEYLD